MEKRGGFKKFFLSANNFFLDLFFPIECLGCGKEGEWVCEKCFQKVKADTHLIRGENLDKIFSFYSYDSEIIKNLIHGLKYRFVEDLAIPIGVLFGNELRKVEGRIGKPDFLVPVPLHKRRYLERGFNQSELIGKFISEKNGWPLRADILLRARKTLPQASLAGAERMGNIKGAFSFSGSDDVKNKKVFLLDDVFTTGATMEECAMIMKKQGAREVIGLAFAKG